MTLEQKEIVRYFCQKAKIPYKRNWGKEDKILERVFDALVSTLMHFGTKRIAKSIKEENDSPST